MRRWIPPFLTAVLALWSLAGPQAYALLGPKWATRQVPYYINPSNNDVSSDAAEAAIQQGAAAWSLQSRADFLFTYMGRTSNATLANNGRNEVFFRNTSNGGLVAETYWWADSGGRMIDADIIFYDGAYTFFTGTTGCSGGLYIEEFATHEFGHVLGLAHSSVSTATMYPTGSWCSNDWRYLDPDDLAGVEALYPPGSSSPNIAPSLNITAPATNTTVADGTAVTFSGSSSDQQDGNLSSQITWSSSLSSQFGIGASVQVALPAGVHLVTASVTDTAGMTTTRQITVTVQSVASPPTPPPAPSPAPSVIALSANGYRVKNNPRVDLTWSGAAASAVDVYRNGARVTTTTNDGAWSDSPGRKAWGTYSYKVCESGGTSCSNTVSVVF